MALNARAHERLMLVHFAAKREGKNLDELIVIRIVAANDVKRGMVSDS